MTKETEPSKVTEPFEDENETENKEKGTEVTSKAMRPLVVITSSYLLYTVTDGAIRMIILLHAYNNSFTAMQVAVMFTLYELAGVMTNLAAGMIGAKWGLRTTLLFGLTLQLAGIGMLMGWKESWDKTTAIIYVTISQMLTGIAKDLTKLGGKTVTKLVTPEDKEGQLFKIVSFVTGMKNSLKGLGYFLGSVLITIPDHGYYISLATMAFLILLAMPGAVFFLSDDLGRVKKSNLKLTDAFLGYPRNLYILSAARMFLFMSRDMWFEVPLPFYLRSPSCDDVGVDCLVDNSSCVSGTECIAGICENLAEGCGGMGLDRRVVGAILASYIIIYGQIQSWTPQLVTTPINKHTTESPPNKNTAVLWCFVNAFPTAVLFFVLRYSEAYDDSRRAEMIASFLVWFAFVFGVNSSIHSFLVVKYAEGNKAAQSVGFYYMSNAAGRLTGTLVSGALYSFSSDNVSHSISYCMLVGSAMSLIAMCLTLPIKDNAAPVGCGPFVFCSPKETDVEGGDDVKE
eukprot:TRINITY_DN10531_c0_g1_i1.p1 TRINITY_DN10531_c0_g1~~TRINITY_DN10531_c0_g1_i1.p1  ORF type:complete len:513 (+),score=63.44 TRINITY_DN10531_c0_g1_i1:37-1575(+)